MQQIKIFEENGQSEENINWWIECNPTYKIININMIPMYDRYPDGNICNQVELYYTTIIWSG